MTALLVTGGIGGGKSTVCRMLRERGIPVYDFDGRTKALYDEDADLRSMIVEAMRPHLGGTPSRMLTADGMLDRKALAEAAFGDSSALRDLESVVHPAVMRDFEAWKASRTEPLIAAESAIALERPLFGTAFDRVLLVDAPYELRLARAACRDGADVKSVERRMRGQSLMNSISRGGPVPESVDRVIVNDGDEAALASALDGFLSEITA